MDRFPKKPCKYCRKMGHFPYQCMQSPKNKKSKGRINPLGKSALKWMATREEWIKNNPPTFMGGYWECYLQIHEWCPQRLTIKTLTLDHVIPRSRAPALRFEPSNLKPACIYCNNAKGSRTIEAVMDAMGKRILTDEVEETDEDEL